MQDLRMGILGAVRRGQLYTPVDVDRGVEEYPLGVTIRLNVDAVEVQQRSALQGLVGSHGLSKKKPRLSGVSHFQLTS